MQNPTKEVSIRKVMAAERRGEEPPELGLAADPRVHRRRSAHRRAPGRWAMIRAFDDGRL